MKLADKVQPGPYSVIKNNLFKKKYEVFLKKSIIDIHLNSNCYINYKWGDKQVEFFKNCIQIYFEGRIGVWRWGN
jgi:hypothetical protein